MLKNYATGFLGTIVMALALGALVAGGSAWAGGPVTKLKTDLEGGGAIASGNAKWEKRGGSTDTCSPLTAKRCKFSVQGEDFAADESVEITDCEGTTHSVTADAAGGFDLNLDSDRAETVPDCVVDVSTVTANGLSSGDNITGTLRAD